MKYDKIHTDDLISAMGLCAYLRRGPGRSPLDPKIRSTLDPKIPSDTKRHRPHHPKIPGAQP